jgi:sugar transferase EpsL
VPRAFDFILLFIALPLLLPVFAISMLLIWISIGRPVFFTQMRGGYKGMPFALYKFRTMTNDTDASGNLLPDAERLTSVGRFLRAASLDELPSLVNLVRGEIRLVGPRPFIADYLPLYSSEQMRRHDVKPGLTGWAQVQGRNAISWDEKFTLDLWYVDNRSFWLDVKVLFMTLYKVIRRDGISAQDDVTMPRFTGAEIK